MRDVTAAFRQVKYTALFDDTKLSSGRFTFRAPADMLWAYQEPDASFLRVSTTEVQFYFPLLEQIEVYPLDARQSMNSVMASLTQDSAALRAQYAVTYHPPGTAQADVAGETVTIADAPGMRLIPTGDELRAQFTQLDVWVRPDSFAPCLLIITEASGDRTTFLFDEIVTNSGVDDVALDFHAPAGTEVIRAATSS